VISSDLLENPKDIIDGLDMDEARSVLLDSWESMEILNEVFSSFHHTFAFFPLPEESPVFFHRIEDLTESWLIVSWEKTPWIPEACSTDHEAI
jgi:hypothetical protein